MPSTMQEAPLTLADILRRGRTLFADSEIVTFEGDSSRRATFAEVTDRVARLAAGLRRLGVRPGDRVGTLCWNHQQHLEAYFAVPCMGAVLHTLNLRLAPSQLAFVVNQGGDKLLIVDAGLVSLLAAIRPQLTTVKTVVVVGGAGLGLGDVVDYEDLIASSPPLQDWPRLDERQAAAMCHSTGTTGDPKGVVYSHRSIWLHSLALISGFSINQDDRVGLTVPMFHVNAWGMPYAAWMCGADLLLPDWYLQPRSLLSFALEERPNFLVGVPTIFQGLLVAAQAAGARLDFVRIGVCGGSAVPVSLMEAYQRWFPLVQAWGMTETSPLGLIALPPRGVTEDDPDYWYFRSKTGRAVPGVELRIVGGKGEPLPWDGRSVGELEVRGPWITGSYLGGTGRDRFHDGWLRTGDVGTVDPRGYVQITDRAKDVIKSGGEWISSVELETHLMAHPAVLDAAVIGISDERWQERPLAVVAFRPGQFAEPEELREFLEGKVAAFWLPDCWAVVAEIPKTLVGKQDKKAIRALQAEGRLRMRRLVGL
ncbi:MAG: long-chain fatty acid--CoA ligase [Candidatus Dormibacteria bacterium]|jgi:fatty-acyl-CoA synthase